MLSKEQIVIIARQVRQEIENEQRIEKENQLRLEKEHEKQHYQKWIVYHEKEREREANRSVFEQVGNFCFIICCTEYGPAFSIPLAFFIFSAIISLAITPTY
uniref:Uncharacterized protein n=1 Tax=viral metagenome TaxID=1070528 RepID=A0A6C0JT23_9ZZZZ